MNKLIICIIFATAVQISTQGEKKRLKYVHITRPIRNEILEFSEEKLAIISAKLKPNIDGPATGNISQSVESGRFNEVGTRRGINLHIIDGSKARIGQFPWQVGIEIDQQNFCGGSIILDTYVLTAAHCTDKSKTLFLVFGAKNIDNEENGRIFMYGKRNYIHPNWDPNLVINDIALVMLPKKLQFSSLIKSIRLPTTVQATYLFNNSNVTICGWGRTHDEKNDLSKDLLFIRMRIVPMLECARTYGPNDMRSSMLCVRGKTKKQGTCQGDSGGPLVIKERDGIYTQLGIVSYGPSVGCDKGYPNVFTRVPSYLGWISSISGIAVVNSRPNHEQKTENGASGKNCTSSNSTKQTRSTPKPKNGKKSEKMTSRSKRKS